MIAQTASGTRGEQGSALLIVFVFAAIVAIALFTEMPITVFEAKRQKEQLLIDRGNEYAHAVRLFVRANRLQYPPSIEALENTNRIRYLRNRYKDPFTGKDDWRLLHAGPNGMLIDSKVQQQQASAGLSGVGGGTNGTGNIAGGAAGSQALGSSITAGANASFAGFNNSGNNVGNNAGINVSNNGGSGSPFADNNGAQGGSQRGRGGFNQDSGAARSVGNSSFGGFFSQPTSTAASSQMSANRQNGAVAQTGTGPQNGEGNRSDNPFTAAAQRAPTAVASPGGTATDASANESATATDGSTQPGQYIPRSRRPTEADLAANAGSQNGAEANATGISAGAATPSQTPSNAFAGNQSPSNGVGGNRQAFGSTAGSNTGGQSFGAGFGSNSNNSKFGQIQNSNLAGVASKAVGLSIKVVNEQESYPLWEFFYDPTKDPMRGALGVQGGAASGQNATNAGANSTTQGFGANNGNSGFGNSNGFSNSTNSGVNSGFGNNSFGNSTMGTGSQAPPRSTSQSPMTTSSYPQ